ncbi:MULTISPECIES: DUF262 domain-containing protein [unclassified Prochlorococcus]|uniref:GmrSD restriction endonuclease domain-containing protein n=1 Tax=unclassified Prochlorococcus TaxID=2627481 RepID=UPI000533833B|nr:MULTISPECIES: DUF262 domain-containing protein [unclassified Prochlorococcus]KGG14709.1 HNH endonuclease [Prochlorococcus sp. MIT 0602]KGG15861.1 HNH endonuclease [Prochlorococcus sp. MIT 0603]
MEIQLHEITIRQLSEGYVDNLEEGVFAYSGHLNIRPPYQREFIYKDAQRDAVIDTVSKNYPLNVMYWAKRSDGDFEIIDGQQRTISICRYVEGDFSVKLGNINALRAFHNLQDDEQDRILNYQLMIYICSGTDSEKLEWFKTINIAGEKLADQELRNAVYSGPWVTDAKKYFSRNNCPAYGYGKDYMNGSPIRQDYLEAIIKWKSKNNIEYFMACNQKNKSAEELWIYFQKIIDWLRKTFPVYRKEMKGIEWGELFNSFSEQQLSADKLEEEILDLMQDEDVTNKKGIYYYVLKRKEKFLNIRSFTQKQKREAYERQSGHCKYCGKVFDIDGMECDHITPWHLGGQTTSDNCQLLCREDNRRKSGK